MALRDKYPITHWILNKENVKKGDIVAYYDEFDNQETHGEIIDIIEPRRIVLELQDGDITIVDFYDTICYNVTEFEKKAPSDCKCCGWTLLHLGCKCGFKGE